MTDQQKLEASAALWEFRKKYAGYQPWNLAKVKGSSTMHEFTSYPFEKDGKVLVMARVLDDPTTNEAYIVRKQIAKVAWSHVRQREYRAGWKAGQAHMRQMQEYYRTQRMGIGQQGETTTK